MDESYRKKEDVTGAAASRMIETRKSRPEILLPGRCQKISQGAVRVTLVVEDEDMGIVEGAIMGEAVVRVVSVVVLVVMGGEPHPVRSTPRRPTPTRKRRQEIEWFIGISKGSGRDG